MRTKPLLPFLILFLAAFVNYAQGIRGSIKNNKGEVLPNASLFISELKTGSSSNNNGEYSIKLPKGNYTLIVKYIGYQSVEFQTEINDAWIQKDFVLKEQDIELKEVAVGKIKREDLAYTIMRKTIAKKRYNQLLYNGFKMTAYIKGSGQLQKAPAIFKRKLEKEGLSMDEAYVSESVSQFTFTQPNKYSEKVISVRTRGDNPAKIGPSDFLSESFYNDKVSGMISPFSRSAFRFYRFNYEGSFTDKNTLVYKIKVEPRSDGDNLFNGTIYILDNYWAIHSVDLNCSFIGFPLSIRQNFTEVAPAVFLPITHQIHFTMSMLGFKGEFKYLISFKDYKVDLNKNLLPDIELLDEKIDEIPEELKLNKYTSKNPVKENKTLTRKQLSKLVDDYEKESFKDQKESNVVNNSSFSIDSLATKRDSAYWENIRPVPLTTSEQKGYRKMDSIEAAGKKAVKDSVNRAGRGFKFADILQGHTYRLSKKQSFTLSSALLKTFFNPVEGVNVNIEGTYRNKLNGKSSLEFSPTIRYGFSGKGLYSKTRLSYFQKTQEHRFSSYLEGGHFISSLNQSVAPNEFANTFSSLLYKRNFMKIYEKTFMEVGVGYKFSDALQISSDIKWEDRNPLSNTSDYSFFFDSRLYTDNNPSNIEMPFTGFSNHQALIVNATLQYRPVLKYRIYNGKKQALTYKSPEFSFTYRKGIDGALGSDIDYDFVELSGTHSLGIGAGNRLDLGFEVGSFLNNSSTSIADYKHFAGNQLSINLFSKPSFRLLDYFMYSTNNSFVSSNVQYHFRKFLLTRIPELRLVGIKENVFFNYLKTSYSPNYFEAGYSIDNIFRLLRFEVAAAFIDGSYQKTGFRAGITSVIKINGK